jgi:ribulose-5-phosphate 4-epimerase/fuculose-1-phosphate aldolase
MTATLPTPATSSPQQFAPEEWQLRLQLAAAYRIFDHLGWCELIYGHISLRLPGPQHHFLINPYGLRYDEMTASSLVKIDLDGNLVEPSDYPVNPAGFVIHSAIHEHRDNAHCIMHTHTRAGMAVAALECGLLPISMNAMSLHGHIAYHDFEGSTLLLEEREKLAQDLGDADGFILRNHGLLSVGRTVAEAFLYLYRLESACQVQLDAMASATELTLPPQAAIERSAQQMRQFAQCAADDIGQLEFGALVRLMDQKDSSYRQ